MPPNSQHSSSTAWSREEVECLIRWIEEHEEYLRGKQSAWHKQVKEEVFSNHDHITVKRIADKTTNMKVS